MSNNFREESRNNWITAEGKQPSNEQLILGCLQRIADATEAMSNSYIQLLENVAYYKGRLAEELAAGKRLYRSNCALRGAVKRAKRRANGNKA